MNHALFCNCSAGPWEGALAQARAKANQPQHQAEGEGQVQHSSPPQSRAGLGGEQQLGLVQQAVGTVQQAPPPKRPGPPSRQQSEVGQGQGGSPVSPAVPHLVLYPPSVYNCSHRASADDSAATGGGTPAVPVAPAQLRSLCAVGNHGHMAMQPMPTIQQGYAHTQPLPALDTQPQGVIGPGDRIGDRERGGGPAVGELFWVSGSMDQASTSPLLPYPLGGSAGVWSPERAGGRRSRASLQNAAPATEQLIYHKSGADTTADDAVSVISFQSAHSIDSQTGSLLSVRQAAVGVGPAGGGQAGLGAEGANEAVQAQVVAMAHRQWAAQAVAAAAAMFGLRPSQGQPTAIVGPPSGAGAGRFPGLQRWLSRGQAAPDGYAQLAELGADGTQTGWVNCVVGLLVASQLVSLA